MIEVFLFSINRNNSILTFLSNVSNENIRKSIELMKKFFGSGHVDMEKILSIYQDQGHYTVPIHELLRSVIFGDNIYYSPTNSEIINLFDVRHHNPNEHFILLILIALLDDYSKNSRNQGFVLIKEVYSYLQGIGFTVTQIDSVLNFAYSKKIFETSQKGDILDAENSELQIRATNLAIFHLRFFTDSFTYIDSIIIDTPIFDDKFRAKILDTMKIKERLERATIFKEYLDSKWNEIQLKPNYFDWVLISSALQKNIDVITSKINDKEIN